MTVKKRAYHSETRDAQAAQTRNRILTAAKNLFQAEGFECVTIEKLAQSAGVSAPTVYALFQSKRGVLRALMEEALSTDEYEALTSGVKTAKSPQARLTQVAKKARQMYDAEKEQMDIFRGAFVVAPEFKELEKEREQRRFQRQEEVIDLMTKEKSLLKGLTFSKAHAILWAFTGRDMYRLFVIEQGWTSDAYEKWLAQMLIRTLIGTES